MMKPKAAQAILCTAALVLTACQSSGQETPDPAATAPPAVSASPASDWLPAAVRTAQSIDPFVGYWLGTTAPRGEVLREATVLLEREPDQAFTITWRNFAADDQAEGMVQRERTLRFVPVASNDIWQAEDSGDPVDGFSAWASVSGNTLSIDVLAVIDTGALERQTYRRSVDGDDMTLIYTRRLDGADDRRIDGALVRLADD